MKFRGVMVDTVPMREFANIILTLSKLCKECVMRLTKNMIYLIVSEENCGPLSPIIWCEIEQTSFFSEYLMEGVNDVNREIYLSFNTNHLARSLLTLKQTAKCFKIKLTKRDFPCLTLEIEVPSTNSLHTRHVTHDIPVTVVSRKDWNSFSEPKLPNYNISIELPPLKQLKSMVDRMKNMSSDLIIKANNNGKLILQIITDLATVSSTFSNLNVEYFNGDKDDDDDNDDEKDYIMCRIDIKKFGNYLNANQSNYTRSLCSIVHNKVINLFLENEGFMAYQCFIPSILY